MYYWKVVMYITGASLVARGKESACNAKNAGDACSIPALGGSPGGGHGTPLQYSCLESPRDRGLGGLQSIESQRVGHN